MCEPNKEIAISGSNAQWMANFLIECGASIVRVDDYNRYIFLNNEIFQGALVELQKAINEGFYFAPMAEGGETE